MNSRFADGSDKIAAFERGMSDEQVHLAFETPGATCVIVDEIFLVVYTIRQDTVVELLRRRLYGNKPSDASGGVTEFLVNEARKFQCNAVIGVS